MFFFFQAEDGIRDLVRSRGLGDVYKRQEQEVGGQLSLELLDARGIVVHKQVDVSPGERVSWERLEPGNHSLRLIEDANSNGRWDAGHWQEQRQPERVRLHGEAIQVRAGWDLGIDWRLKGD